MARRARLAVPGLPHLLEQRGHGSAPLFPTASLRDAFVDTIREVSRLHRVAVHAYSLRDDHVRLLVTPPSAQALSAAMQALARAHTAALKRLDPARRGSAWEGRFRGAPIEPDEWLVPAMRFVEAEGLADPLHAPEDARGSLAHHLGRQVDVIITEAPAFWRLGNTPFDREAAYRRLVAEPLGTSARRALERAASGGWPLGTERFLTSVAQATVGSASRVVPGRPGRPRTGLNVSVPNKIAQPQGGPQKRGQSLK